ncbi:peptidoglycan DD-metalloendopeptidase family protein [Pradoshia sp.]|uniref:peptidoglycan DD-metalloendopeptidase family protein n=1 Tax=Pradoshia sp. TaxID=2651281 RepID=UPI003F0CEF0C
MAYKNSADVRRRIAQRRKNREKNLGYQKREAQRESPILADKELDWGAENMVVYDEGIKSPPNKVFIKKEWMLFQVLASTCLVLVMAIVYRTSAPWTDDARELIGGVYEQEFQFASVVNWFDETVGQPFAFLPENADKEKEEDFSMPASGTIMESFENNGQGVIVKTAAAASVGTVKEGVVIYAGEKEEYGKTVIIQHADKSESWYGSLESIDVSLYEQVKKGAKLGRVQASEEEEGKGEFYFALKSEGRFIDPGEVISFE